MVNAVTVLAERNAKFMPEILVMGGANGGSSLDGVAATLMRYLGATQATTAPAEPPATELSGVSAHYQPADNSEPAK